MMKLLPKKQLSQTEARHASAAKEKAPLAVLQHHKRLSQNLFLSECVNGEVEYIKGYKLTVPMLSYPEMLYEAQIIEEADLLQEMTSELFESA